MQITLLFALLLLPASSCYAESTTVIGGGYNLRGGNKNVAQHNLNVHRRNYRNLQTNDTSNATSTSTAASMPICGWITSATGTGSSYSWNCDRSQENPQCASGCKLTTWNSWFGFGEDLETVLVEATTCEHEVSRVTSQGSKIYNMFIYFPQQEQEQEHEQGQDGGNVCFGSSDIAELSNCQIVGRDSSSSSSTVLTEEQCPPNGLATPPTTATTTAPTTSGSAAQSSSVMLSITIPTRSDSLPPTTVTTATDDDDPPQDSYNRSSSFNPKRDDPNWPGSIPESGTNHALTINIRYDDDDYLNTVNWRFEQRVTSFNATNTNTTDLHAKATPSFMDETSIQVGKKSGTNTNNTTSSDSNTTSTQQQDSYHGDDDDDEEWIILDQSVGNTSSFSTAAGEDDAMGMLVSYHQVNLQSNTLYRFHIEDDLDDDENDNENGKRVWVTITTSTASDGGDDDDDDGVLWSSTGDQISVSGGAQEVLIAIDEDGIPSLL